MVNPPFFAELTEEELEVIQELESTLSHIKGRTISLVAYDLGEDAEYEFAQEEYDTASVTDPQPTDSD